jgi:hypothetical protein
MTAASPGAVFGELDAETLAPPQAVMTALAHSKSRTASAIVQVAAAKRR